VWLLVIANGSVTLADWHLQTPEDLTQHWIRHGTATLVGPEGPTEAG